MRLFVSALEYSANIHLKYLLCELIKHENDLFGFGANLGACDL